MVAENLLVYILMFPVIGILLLCFIPARKKTMLKFIALTASFSSFLGSLLLWGVFNKSIVCFQLIKAFFSLFPIIILNFSLNVGETSSLILVLTTLLIPFFMWVIWNSWNNVGHNLKEFLISFLVLDFLSIGVFTVVDLLFFYIFFAAYVFALFFLFFKFS